MKTQPNRGFGGLECSKPRILRGLRGSRTMNFEAPETRNHVFYVVLEHFGLKNRSPGASGRPPEAPRKPRRLPGGSQGAPEAENSVKIAYLHMFYVCFKWCSFCFPFRPYPRHRKTRTSGTGATSILRCDWSSRKRTSAKCSLLGPRGARTS